jgi:Tol biopolymer transport system component
MKPQNPSSLILLLGLLAILAVGPLAGAELASANAQGTAAGNAASFNPSLSANGRFVAFESTATDLVPGGSPPGVNIFVRDLLEGTTVLASVNEAPYIGAAEFPHLSADGRYVAYQRSTCTSPFCPTVDVFVRDLQAGTTTLVSVDQNGQPGGGSGPVISADGRHVAFQSASANLVPGDANGTVDVFVRDLDTGTTRLASVNAAGAGSGNGASRHPALSADGHVVAFESDASDLVAGDANGATDVFARDLQAGVTRLVSVNTAGTGSGNGASSVPTLSADGSRVAFDSFASDLVPVDTNGSPDVFVRDLPAGPTRLVSVNQAGTDSASFSSVRPYLTPSGRFVAFQSNAADLAPNDFNSSGSDVFLRDLDAGVTRLVSVNAAGTGTGDGPSELFLAFDTLAGFQVASDDGRFVVFGSAAQDLVTGVSYPCETSPCYQVYRRDLQAGVTTLLSATPDGTMAGNAGPLGFELGGQISSDGRVAVFQSPASNLSRLPDTNNANDVFFAGVPQAPALADVPALSGSGAALLALLMAGLGLWALRR